MPKSVDLSSARRLLLSRDQLIAAGHSEREIRERVSGKQLVRLRRGRYVDASEWSDLWNEGKHLLHVLALHDNAGPTRPVFWGPSAAVLHGLPLYRLAPANVHTVIQTARHGRSRAKVVLHNVQCPGDDIVEVDGMLCTSPDRTVLDLACSTAPATGLSAADAALRREAVSGHHHDPDSADAWHARLAHRAGSTSVRGIRKARDILGFADGRAQLPGESVSRLHLRTLGYRGYRLQEHVVGPIGEDYWLDFAFPRSRMFGEFDGEGKYLNEEMRQGKSLEDVLLAEKHREDAVRGVTNWGFARWGSEHVRTVDLFAQRLRAFGIHPPC
ncbi:hypothetical protein WDU99_11190 [Microbacterium sp. Mu-80]|uniref:Transcriptional regulator, AbiEi antitoxin, Type IV TA system n=1 Tax=Microbacterium bandirmense TaxID=3122050 RepID=A0ABU8LC30_9MICO